MKKTMSVLLALVLLLALSVPAMAAGEGTITINNAVVGQTYTIYEILYLESYNPAEGSEAYAYKATTAWNEFINSAEIKGTYMDVDAQGYVTWKDGADAAAFAKLARAYAAEKNLANQGQKTAEKKDDSNITTVTFDNLDLGYYLLDSTLGTLCSLDTTNPTVTIKEKNAEPTNVKTVEEDADIGQTVYFKSTVTAQAGAENYVFHDKMSEGLTYTGVTSVKLNGNDVDAENYTVKSGNDVTDNGCTFEVVFTQAFCDTLKAGDKIEISYTATVNEKAVVGGNGNPNESKLSYGDSSSATPTTTPPSTTTTYTWKIDVLKYTMKGDEEVKLADAVFTLSRDEKGTDLINLVKVKDNVYRVAKNNEEGAITQITTDATGAFTIKGLDSDTYYLTEITQPAGYNKLAAPIKVVIDDKGNVTYNGEYTGTVKVENKSGAELPSTGGIGTTVFYVVGGLMVLIAIVLLVTRKKMSVHKD